MGKLYVLLRKNQKKEFEKLSSFTKTGKDHGRIEKREYYTFCDEQIIKHLLETKWESVNGIGMTRVTRIIGEAKTIETQYHLLDQKTNAEAYENLARGHWSIENSLH